MVTDTAHDWALITGASSGIGRALAAALASRGIAVVASGRDHQRLAGIEAQCRTSAPAVSCAADLAIPDDRKRLAGVVAHAAKAPGRLRFFIHCAGVGDPAADLAKTAPAALDEAIAINATAALDLTQRLLPLLKETPQSRLLFVGAGIADRPQPGTGIYGISKKALARLFEQMLIDFEHQADHGLPALAMFQPGLVYTAGLRDHIAKAERCRLPHAAWLRQRLTGGDALSPRQAAGAMASALIDLDRDAFHGQTLHARAFLSEGALQDKS